MVETGGSEPAPPLRADGVPARSARSSAFVAVEGILLGTTLSVPTAWLLFTNSPAVAVRVAD